MDISRNWPTSTSFLKVSKGKALSHRESFNQTGCFVQPPFSCNLSILGIEGDQEFKIFSTTKKKINLLTININQEKRKYKHNYKIEA